MMRAVIRRPNFRIEFSGRGEMWNELLRPYLGGPQAPPEPIPSPVAAAANAARPSVASTPVHHPAEPAAHVGTFRPAASYSTASAPTSSAAIPARPSPSQPRTWYPPRPQTPQRFEPRYPGAEQAVAEEEEVAVQVEPSSDPATLYQRLTAIPGRRSERDAVLAAVWFLTKGERETTADEVEAHFDAHHVFPDVKVVPHLLKHVHRTKMFEQGSGPKAVKLSMKGASSVKGRLVPE